MSRAYDLRLELQNHLDIPDPPHGYCLFGIRSAAKWFNGLSANEQFLLVDYLVQEIKIAASLKLGSLGELTMLASASGNRAFLPLLERIAEHARYLEYECNQARKMIGKEAL